MSVQATAARVSEVRAVPFSRPSIGEEEIAEVASCLRSGWITTGPRTAQFEKEFAAYVGARHAAAVTSATAGLHLALLALDLRPGDEVVTSPMTWPATLSAILFAGGTPVLADVDHDTLNLDPAAVERAIGPRTRALLPVHFAGQPCDLDALLELARPRAIRVIDDAAHAVGTELRGRRIGSIADASVFSFHPIKNITTGEGGMVTTADDEFARRVRLLRFHGVERDAWKRYAGGADLPHYDVVEPGLKYNLTDLQSAIGIHQLRKLDAFIARRELLARRYDRRLAAVSALRPLGRVPFPSRHAHHLYVVRLDGEGVSIDREALMSEVQRAGVGLGLHFTAVHQLTAFRRRLGDLDRELPVASSASRRIFSLPLYPDLAEADVDWVVDVLERTIRSHRR